MSKTAISNFFQHQRDVIANQEARREERRKQRLVKKTVVVDPFNEDVAEVHTLLKRNWFVEEHDILDLLWELDEQGFQEIVKRRSEYDTNIRQIVEQFLPKDKTLLSKLKYKIREITDEEVEAEEERKVAEFKKKMDDAWETYKEDFELTPPVGEAELKLTKIEAELETAKKELEAAKKESVSGRYVAPAAREATIAANPKVVEIQNKIQKLEAQIPLQKELIDQEKDIWFRLEKYEFDMDYLKKA